MNFLIISSEQEPPDSYKTKFGKMHPHYETTPIISRLLQNSGHDVSTTTNIGILASETIKPYEAIIYNTTREGDLTLSLEERTSLTQYIGGGGGFACIHFAGVLPENWPNFHDITGGGWIRETSTHQPYGEIAITVSDTKHPCSQDVINFTTHDELYIILGYKPDNDVFLTASDGNKNWPMAWTRKYGKGRVFNTPLGHDAKSFESPSFQRLILNGIEWAGTKE